MARMSLKRARAVVAVMDACASIGPEGVTAEQIAERAGVSTSTARKHALALAEAGKLRAYKSRRYTPQARYTSHGIEGASCMRRVLTFTLPTDSAPAGIFGSY